MMPTLLLSSCPDDQTSGLGGGQDVAGGGSPSLDQALIGGGFVECVGTGGSCLGHQLVSVDDAF